MKARDIPEQTHSGSDNRSKVVAQPEAGTRQGIGKTNQCDSVLTDPGPRTPEAVRQATADEGACLRAGLKQRTTDDGSEASNPKHRTRNEWGIPDGAGK